MGKRLTVKAIWYVINQLEKGRSASEVAARPEVTPRHIRRLQTKFRETRSAHIPRLSGQARPVQQVTLENAMVVLQQTTGGSEHLSLSCRIMDTTLCVCVKRIRWDSGNPPSLKRNSWTGNRADKLMIVLPDQQEAGMVPQNHQVDRPL